MKKALVLLTMLLLTTACATTQPSLTSTPLPPTEPPPTPLPEPTNTSIPPTQLPPLIEVTYDGNECTVTGPTELPKGKHSFVLYDLSEHNAVLWVNFFLDRKTFQDYLDLQSEPGEYVSQPYWTVNPPLFGQAWDDSIGGEVYTLFLDKEGEYCIGVYDSSPESIWFCAPIWVIEAPSE